MREEHRPPSNAPISPYFSLLRLSASARLLGASIVILALWGGVFWALR